MMLEMDCELITIKGAILGKFVYQSDSIRFYTHDIEKSKLRLK